MAGETTTQVVVEVSGDASMHGWDEYVESHAHGTFFHSSLWRDLLIREFPHRPRYLELIRDGRRVAVLPLFETRSPLSGRALVSVPYAVYGGALTDDPDAERALLQHVRALVDQEGYRFADLRCTQEPALELPGSTLYTTFLRELPDDPEECLGMIPRKSRATTRQARDRHGLTFAEAPECLDDFHRLFVLNKQKLGSPAFSRRFFARLLDLRGRVRLHVVRKDQEVLIAVLSFLHGNTWNPYYSGSLPWADRLGASNFAYWKLMCVASSEGYRTFDFGRSRADTGPFKFKKNMGFEPTPLPYRYVLAEGQSIPQINPSNPSFSIPRKVIQSLPFSLARLIGPCLMRLVP